MSSHQTPTVSVPQFPASSRTYTYNHGDTVSISMAGYYFRATGGSGSYRYSWRTKPNLTGTGLSFSTSGTIISGTASNTGNSNKTASGVWRVQDLRSPFGQDLITVNIIIRPRVRVTIPPIATRRGADGDVFGLTQLSRSNLAVATGGDAPYTYSLKHVSGPTLAQLNMRLYSGTVFGTYRNILVSSAAVGGLGTAVYELEATDDEGRTASRAFHIIISAPPSRNPLTISGLTIRARVGESVDEELPLASGGTKPYTYTVTGITWSSYGLRRTTASGTSGSITGTPTKTVSADYGTIRVRDGAGNTKTATLQLTILAAPIATLTLPSISTIRGTHGGTLNRLLPAASGGSGTKTYSITHSSGPTLAQLGISFNSSTRRITSSSLVGKAGGSSNYYIATDSRGRTVQRILSVIVPAPPVDELELNNKTIRARIGESVSEDLPLASGGTSPYTYTFSGISWSSYGLTHTPAGGTSGSISGTPTRTTSSDTGTLRVRDADGSTTTATITLIVLPAAIATLTLPSISTIRKVERETLNQLLPAASGGSGTKTYSISHSSGPTLAQLGISFNSTTRRLTSSRLIAGTGTSSNYYVATDSANNVVQRILSVTVTARAQSTLRLATTTVTGAVGRYLSTNLKSATGGRTPYRYTVPTVNYGSLGLSYSHSQRRIFGTPNRADDISGNVTVTDANGDTWTATVRIDITGNYTWKGSTSFTFNAGATVNSALPKLSPEPLGVSYSVSNTSGLASLGLRISGTTLLGTAASTLTGRSTTFTLQARWAGFTRRVTISVTVRAQPPRFQSSSVSLTVNHDANVNWAAPIALGGQGTRTYSVLSTNGGLTGTGLGLSREITNLYFFRGKANAVNGLTRTLTYQVRDGIGQTDTILIYLRINRKPPKPPASLTLVSQSFTIPDNTARTITLATATGGTPPYTYSRSIVGSLPTGVSIDATGRVLTIVARTLNGIRTGTINRTVRDRSNPVKTATATVAITIRGALRIASKHFSFSVGYKLTTDPIQGLVVDNALPTALGGDGDYTYTITGLTNGISYHRISHRLIGTVLEPTRRITAVLTVRDGDNKTATSNITIDVNARDPLDIPPEHTIRAKRGETVDWPCPIPSNAIGPLVYSGTMITGLSVGLDPSRTTYRIYGVVNIAKGTYERTLNIVDTGRQITGRTKIIFVITEDPGPGGDAPFFDPHGPFKGIYGETVDWALPRANGTNPLASTKFTYTLSDPPADLALVIDDNGHPRLKGVLAQVGTFTLSLTAVDSLGGRGGTFIVVIIAGSSDVTVPEAPQKPTFSPGSEIGILCFRMNADGGAPIIAVQYRYSVDGGTTWGAYTFVSPTDRVRGAVNISGLTNDVAHIFQVRAQNRVGFSDPSPSSDPQTPAVGKRPSVCPDATAPLAPPKPTCTPRDKSVVLEWQSGGDGGSRIIAWEYQQRTGGVEGIATEIPDSTEETRSHPFVELTNGVVYQWRIRAKNLIGTGPWSPYSDECSPEVGIKFPRSLYVLRVISGHGVNWPIPEATGGIGELSYSLSDTLPKALLLGPSYTRDGEPILAIGGVAGPPVEKELQLIATDEHGSTGSVTLRVIIRSATAGLGSGTCRQPLPEDTRVPTTDWAFSPENVEPDDEGKLAIRNFSTDLIARPGESRVLTWNVDTNFQDVPVLEVDLYVTDPVDPLCEGVRPNLIHERGVGYVGTKEVTLPDEEGVWLFRLVALRGGQADSYVAIDWWDLTIRTTNEAQAAHISASKSLIPSLYPSILQWAYRGVNPSSQELSTEDVEPEGVDPIHTDDPEPNRVPRIRKAD